MEKYAEGEVFSRLVDYTEASPFSMEGIECRRKARSRPGRVVELRASVEDELLSLVDEETGAESRWHRPRKRRISLRVDTEVVDWFKSKGPG